MLSVARVDRHGAVTCECEGCDPAARFLAGSVGKTYTAAAALSLVAERKLDLDAPIATWLAGESWFPRLPHRDAITPRMLLSHTAGVADHRAARRFIAALSAELTARPPNRDLYFSPQQLVEFALGEPPVAVPATTYSYSETGYILAGMIIEHASGQSLVDLVQKRFLDPLRLRGTIAATHRDIAGLVNGHVGANPVGLPEWSVENGRLAFNPATEWAGGGYAATAADTARWAWSLFGGQILPAAQLADMLTPPFELHDRPVRYGLGCYLWQTPHGEAIGHTGEAPGYRSIVAYFPQRRSAIAILINSSVEPRERMHELLAMFGAPS